MVNRPFTSIIMEYCDGGDLYQSIIEHKKKGMYFREAEIWNVLIQLLKGLKELHSKHIYHRDLKVLAFLGERKRIPRPGRRGQTRGYERVQARQEGPALHPDGHALLRFA